ncbi:MAG: hypothetical protein J6Q47_03035 [Paludibacteraceae bacterium]|jgi:hypothetical protein|nr:hypothetical protein [Paludibacteraceae bacterium]
MKQLLKYLGVFMLLIGVAVLVAYNVVSSPNNNYLISALSLMIVGLITHVLLNKYLD